MLSVDEVARHYGVRPDTVRRRIRTGELGAVVVPRGVVYEGRPSERPELVRRPRRAA
jgi:hypothetical protein